MIHHCVWLRYRPSVSPQERAALADEIRALVGVVPGVLQVMAAPNARHEDLDHGFADGFIVVLQDRAALQAYQAHPAHQDTGRRLVAAAQGGLQGLLVFDLETP